MSVIDSAVNFVPNLMKRSMYFGHQLGDVVLPRLLQKVGMGPVASELAALPVTAAGAGAALWFGGTNVIAPFFGTLLSGIFNPLGLTVFLPALLVFAAVTCVGIGMGDVVLKKFGKTPIFEGVYDNMAYRSERKQKLANKAAQAKAEATLEQQRALDAQQSAPAAAATPPQGTKPFAGNEPGAEQPPYVGARNAGSFNAAAQTELTEAGVPKFAGFPPTVDNEQGPRERPERPARPDKP